MGWHSKESQFGCRQNLSWVLLRHWDPLAYRSCQQWRKHLRTSNLCVEFSCHGEIWVQKSCVRELSRFTLPCTWYISWDGSGSALEYRLLQRITWPRITSMKFRHKRTTCSLWCIRDCRRPKYELHWVRSPSPSASSSQCGSKIVGYRTFLRAYSLLSALRLTL